MLRASQVYYKHMYQVYFKKITKAKLKNGVIYSRTEHKERKDKTFNEEINFHWNTN